MTKSLNIKPPMSYQGGKQKISSKIINFIFQEEYDAFVDVCCGSGAVSIELFNRNFLAENIYMFDGGPIGAFWQMVSEGTFDLDKFEKCIDKIPKDKSKIKKYLKHLSYMEFSHIEDAIYEYLILQAGSFGAKQIWDKSGKFLNTSFRDYWMPTETSSRKSPVNPMMPMPDTLFNNVKNIVENMMGIRATHTLVDNIDFDFILSQHRKIAIYIDPPYSKTTGYGLEVNLSEFIKNAKKYGDVYVSEYQPASEKYIIMNKTNKGGISGNSNKVMVEYLSKVNMV